jgi:histone-lysine N-methyltransferase SUV39H
MEVAFARHFDHHGKGEVRFSNDHNLHRTFADCTQRYADEREKCHWCQLRAFDTHRKTPITIVNDVDSVAIPPNFRFIEKMIYRRGVMPAEDNFRSGCDCQTDLDCQYGGCQCLSDLLDGDEDEDDENTTSLDGQGSHHRKKKYAYHLHGAKKGLMRSEMLETKLPLYECHESCSCSASCPNRVVEQGRTVPLQIFRTENRGWGMFMSMSEPQT